MIRLSRLGILGVFLAVVLPAAAEEASETVIRSEKTEEESPIRHLAEVRFDEHVVQARALNLPLPGKTRTVRDILEQFDKFAEDDKIGAVLLDIGNLWLGYTDIVELKSGVEKLKKADKEVCAFLNGTGPMGYLLACSADEIVLPPIGEVIVPGLGAMFPYMKGYFQMVGFEFEVITAGRYKYPGFVNAREPNEHFEQEINTLFDSWFADYKRVISEGRGLPTEKTAEAIDHAVFTSDEARQWGLVDKIAYYDEYRDRILSSQKLKKYKDDGLDLSRVNSIQDLFEMINRELKKAEEARKAVGPKVAVLHARGPIIDFSLGATFASLVISRDDFVEVVEELRKNKSIKAVVMRVDSPGGSAYASDVIWKALNDLDEQKPLVVSMGSVAGSGGYYIACPGRRIFAQPTTITGSIGVISIFQSAWSYFNRQDYEISTLERGARSLLGAGHRTLSDEDRAFIQKLIDDIYDVFVRRVANSRQMPEQEVRKIAEGRIYTGRQALDLGLVDELGGLAEAIESAREFAGIPESAELKVLHYPRPSSLGELFESFSVSTPAVSTFRELMGPAQSLSFEEQLMIFSRSAHSACWMGVPAFCQPGMPVLPHGSIMDQRMPGFSGSVRP